jgi:hypothetical protein
MKPKKRDRFGCLPRRQFRKGKDFNCRRTGRAASAENSLVQQTQEHDVFTWVNKPLKAELFESMHPTTQIEDAVNL